MKRFFLLVLLTVIGLSSYAQSSGYEKSVELKGGVGLDDRTDYNFGVSMVNGYRFNDNLYIGVGAGYEYLRGLYYHSFNATGLYSTSYDSKSTQNLIQLFARVKVNFTSANVSPFASLDLGNTFNTNSTDEIKMANGFFFEPAVGCDFKLNKKQTFYFSLGYNQQQYEYEFIAVSNNSGHELEKKPAGSFNVHVGLKF